MEASQKAHVLDVDGKAGKTTLAELAVAKANPLVSEVAAAFWMSSIAGTLLGTNVNDGMTSVAMQQGGRG